MFINTYIMEGKKKHDDIILLKKCDKNLVWHKVLPLNDS